MSRSHTKRKKTQPSLTAEWRSWYESKGPVLRFCLKFGALMVVFYALLATPYFERLLYGYLEVNTWVSSWLLNLFGQHTQVTGITLQSSRFSVSIERGCDAVEPTWLVLAAIIASPSRVIFKIYGILAGIVILQLLNVLRIISLFFIGVYQPSVFNTVHMEIWPTAFILAAMILFVYWRDWAFRRQPHVLA